MAEELDPRTMTQGDLPDPEPPLQVTIRQVSATRVEATWLPQGDADLFRAELLDEDDAAILAADGTPVYADIAATFVRLTVPYAGTLQRVVKVRVSPLHPNGTVYAGTTTDAIAVTTQFDGSYVSEISADKITSGSITSDVIVSGRIRAGGDFDSTGGYVELKGSGIEWVPAGQTNPSVVLPSVGDASFTGVSVTASKGLDATGITMRGTGTLSDNASITLSEGTVADPTAQATVASAWPTEFSIAAGNWTGAAYDSAGTSFWFARSDGVRSYTAAGSAGANYTFVAQGWTPQSSGATLTLWAVAYSEAEAQWVATGSGGAIYTSPDAVTWTSRTSGTSQALYGIARSGGDDLWVAVGTSGAVVTSGNGSTWTLRTSGKSDAIYGVARSEAEDLWTAVGSNGLILTSPDGTTWTSRTGAGTTDFKAIARSEADDLWVAVGAPSKIYSSPDGTTWTARTSPVTTTFNSVARSDAADLWVAVGTNGIIVTSPDGTTWTSRTSGTTNALYGVAYSEDEGLWVAVGYLGTVLTSPDGITWTTRSLGSTSTLRAIGRSESDDRWLATGNSGVTFTSPDAGVGTIEGAITGVATGTGDASSSRGFALGATTLGRFNKATGTSLQTVNASAYASKATRASLFYDDSKIKVVTQDASGSSGKVQLVAYDPANLSTAPTTQTLDAGFTGNFSFYGAARFTAGTTDYYAIALTDGGTRSGVYCFNATSGSRAATYDFYDSQGNVPDGGMAYDGTRFYTLATPSSTALQKHSTFHPGSATQNTYVRYSYADASNETQISPAANLALAARGYVSIVIPDASGGASKVRVYVRGAASDATGANTYRKISTGDENLLLYTYGDVDFTTGLDVNVGSLGPWAGADGEPATIQSGAAGWELTGDGLIVLTEQSEPAAPAANKAVLFLKDNGSGKTQLCVRFSSGATQVIATQP